MKICIFGDERSIHIRRWVEGLRSLGNHVDLITLVKDRDHDFGAISLDASSKLSYLTRIGRLRSIIAELEPDIFHAHHASSFGFLASFVAHPAKILSVWGYDIVTFPYKNFLNRRIILKALSGPRLITATSRFLKESVLKLNNGIRDIEVVPFGVDIEMFNYSRRQDKSEIVVGTAKSLKPKYGIDILIRAFGILKSGHENIKLKIAGGGRYEEEYKDLTHKLGLDDSIDFLALIEHSLLPGLFKYFDIFAMPSVYDDESFGVAALEAAATGLPVVATKVGGVPEVVEDGRTGFLVERRDSKKLAEALEKLTVNRELRLKMGKAGRELVESKYDWSMNLQAMNALYEKTLADTR